MQQQILQQIEDSKRERNALIAEANERAQAQQRVATEHGVRMNEIQTRVSQLEGAIQALEQLVLATEK